MSAQKSLLFQTDKLAEGFQKALELIKENDTIIIHRHTNPDGDAIGSQMGLKFLLQQNFPQKTIFVVGDPAKRFSFVEGSTMDEIDDSVYKNALAIVLDTSAKALISDNRYPLAKQTLRFDHHIFVENICDVEVVDTSCESCAGLIAKFAKTLGLVHSKSSAQALFTGMVTDSGRFRYDSTSANTLRLAADLMENGVNPSEIYGPLYADDFEMIKLRASFVLQIQFTQHNVAYIYTTKERLAELNADTFTVSRGMVGVMSEIRGVDSWVNFTETDAGVLCELRSKKFNINPIAVKYGGGGHAKASGATVPNREVAMQMLADLDKQVCGE